MKKAVSLGFLKSFIVESQEVSHLQYADDTLFI